MASYQALRPRSIRDVDPAWSGQLLDQLGRDPAEHQARMSELAHVGVVDLIQDAAEQVARRKASAELRRELLPRQVVA